MLDSLTSQIDKVYVESCCGTWCVWVKEKYGSDTFRVARIDMSVKGSKAKATKFAKELDNFLKEYK